MAHPAQIVREIIIDPGEGWITFRREDCVYTRVRLSDEQATFFSDIVDGPCAARIERWSRRS